MEGMTAKEIREFDSTEGDWDVITFTVFLFIGAVVGCTATGICLALERL